jgi:AraC-like DNA-binding protein
MTNRFRISATLPRQLEEVAISPASVLRQARLPITLFDQGKVWLTTEEMFSLYAAIEQVSGDATIGLKLGNGLRPEHYSPIHIAALHTRSFRDALNRIARYKRLMGPEEIHVVERGKECGVQFVWLLADTPEPSTLVDLCFAWTVSVGRRGTGKNVDAVRVEFVRPEVNRRLYEKHFGCPVRFGARHNKIFFSVEDINQPFITYNPDLLEVIAPQLEAELAQELAATSFKEHLKAVLKRSLAGRKPRVEDAAHEMRVSVRTLQRRLLDEGLTFQSLVEDARREMAHHYLRQPSLELIDTAYLLGYEDPNSFIRAFQRWEGTSPGQWRSGHSPGVFLTQ